MTFISGIWLWAAVAALCLGCAAFLESASGWFVSRAVDPASNAEHAKRQARMARRSRMCARFCLAVAAACMAWVTQFPWGAGLFLGSVGLSLLGAVLLAGTWHSPAALTGRALMRVLGFPGRFLDSVVIGLSKLVRLDPPSAVDAAEVWDRELEWLRAQPREEEADRAVEAVYEFRLTRVEDVMVPREEVVGIPAEATAAQAVEVVAREGHSRYPVFRGSLDDAVGVLHVFDLLEAEPQSAIRDLARAPLMTAATRSLSSLLRELQTTYNQFAVVADELGGTAGIVTVEDLLEELVGDIGDETDADETQITRVEEGIYRVDAGVRIDDLNEELDLELPEGEYDTIAGLVLERLERVPRTGERMQVAGVWLEVVDAEPHRIQEMNVIVDPPNRGASRGNGK